MYIKEIKRAPYICIVPSSGPHAIKCYPDAKTWVINGQKFGYSRREQTMIAPMAVSKDEIENAKKFFEEISLSKWKGLFPSD